MPKNTLYALTHRANFIHKFDIHFHKHAYLRNGVPFFQHILNSNMGFFYFTFQHSLILNLLKEMHGIVVQINGQIIYYFHQFQLFIYKSSVFKSRISKYSFGRKNLINYSAAPGIESMALKKIGKAHV